MPINEDILNSAIAQLKSGKTIAEVLALHGNDASELLPLLEVATMGMEIPKLAVPTPMRRRKFAEATLYSGMWANLLTFTRVAIIPLSIVIALVGGRAVVTAADNSLPGDALYSLKRATETARLNLTFDQDKVASLHVEYTQKRIDEVKQAINNNNPKQEKAAIEALQEQSDKTFATVPSVAAANAITKNDPKLLDNLVAINKEQKDVLSTVPEQADSKATAETALNSAKENSKTLAIIIATVHDQTAADLSKISVTGIITQLYKNRLTVEGNTFTINDKTEILNADGEAATIKDISGKVAVLGTKDGANILAVKITIVEPTPVPEPVTTPQVKGVTTTTTPKPSTPIVQPPVVPATDPNQASGTFIVEPSDSQYVP